MAHRQLGQGRAVFGTLLQLSIQQLPHLDAVAVIGCSCGPHSKLGHCALDLPARRGALLSIGLSKELREAIDEGLRDTGCTSDQRVLLCFWRWILLGFQENPGVGGLVLEACLFARLARRSGMHLQALEMAPSKWGPSHSRPACAIAGTKQDWQQSFPR